MGGRKQQAGAPSPSPSPEDGRGGQRTQPRPYREVLAERRAAQPQGEPLPERDEDEEPVSPADEGADAQDEE